MEHLGHPRCGPELTRVRNPGLNPIGLQLASHAQQARTWTAIGWEPIDLVTGIAPIALDQTIALGQIRRIRSDQLHRGLVTLHTARFGMLVRQHGVVPVVLLVPVVLIFPGRFLCSIAGSVVCMLERERLPRASMTGSTAHDLGGVRRLAGQV